MSTFHANSCNHSIYKDIKKVIPEREIYFTDRNVETAIMPTPKAKDYNLLPKTSLTVTIDKIVDPGHFREWLFLIFKLLYRDKL